ncbi:MAG: RIP metalloprotease RseP [Gammaproteobacteria bacterium]|nr:MAG: RIP metalloprotease RseP [Gammaproteobacteria bacterium]
MEIFTSILAFIVALGLLVAIHEYGHFYVARRLGVKVLRFCIGFGKPIWSRVAGRDPVEYAVAAIPLGGYVKLLDEREGPVADADLPRAFTQQTPVRRIAILAAGPAFNFLFAVAAYWLMFVTGVVATKPLIGAIEQGSLADRGGVRSGDEIISVDGRQTPTLMDAQLGIVDTLVSDGRVPMTVSGEDGSLRRVELVIDSERSEFTEDLAQLLPKLGIQPWRPVLPPILENLSPDGTAAGSGLLAGDRILEAEGQEVVDWSGWVDFVRQRPGQTIDVVFERDGARMEMPLQIGQVETDDGVIGRIGAGVHVPEDLYEKVLTEQHYGPLEAVGHAAGKTWDMSAVTLRLIYRMLTGDVSPRNLSGPINIAQAAGYTASAGLAAFLNFLAIVSVSLGILNLLPIPMLDGGQIAYQVAEMVKGSPVSERAQLIGQQVGIVLLLLLMSFAFYNDIVRISG